MYLQYLHPFRSKSHCSIRHSILLTSANTSNISHFACNSMDQLVKSERSAMPSQGDLVQSALIRAPAPLLDIGANLGDKSFIQDLPEVLKRSVAANVGTIIITGTSVKSSTAASLLCEKYSEYPLYFTAGVHPHDASSCDHSTLPALKALAAHPRCVAIGETGLDFNRNYSPQAAQLEWFEKQVTLACELGKPLFLHSRDAHADMMEVLDRSWRSPGASKQTSPPFPPAVVHCFTGNASELDDALSRDLHIGITGWVCDERPDRGGPALAQLLVRVPANRLMIETDAPYLTPRTIKPSRARPSRNEPALLPYVLRTIAQALGKTEEQVAVETTAVAKAFFGITS